MISSVSTSQCTSVPAWRDFAADERRYEVFQSLQPGPNEWLGYPNKMLVVQPCNGLGSRPVGNSNASSRFMPPDKQPSNPATQLFIPGDCTGHKGPLIGYNYN